MYYVEKTRYGRTETLPGCTMSKKEAKKIIEEEKERMKKRGIVKIGDFKIIKMGAERPKMRVKSSRYTWDKKEFAGTGYGEEV